ncbi:MAG: hypothetical protein ACRDRO_12780, partial [Pseudonocardiaceae bacterium]
RLSHHMIAVMLAWPAAATTTYATSPTERSSQKTTARLRPRTCTTDAVDLVVVRTHAQAIGVPMNIAVVDGGGYLIVFASERVGGRSRVSR